MGRMILGLMAAHLLLWSGVAQAAEGDPKARISENGWLNFPYDGIVMSEDLLSSGHNLEQIYTELYRLASPIQKDEFETTETFKERSNFRNRLEKFIASYGTNFLLVEPVGNYILEYDADNMAMRIDASKTEIKLGLFPLISSGYQYPENSLQHKESSYGVTCNLTFKIFMTAEEAKEFKSKTKFGRAINFAIGASDPVFSKKGDIFNKKDRSNRRKGDEEISVFPGFANSVKSYWGAGSPISSYVTNYTNWISAELIIFDISDGSVIARHKCKNSIQN